MHTTSSSWRLAVVLGVLLLASSAPAQQVDGALYREVARSIKEMLPSGLILADANVWASRVKRRLAVEAQTAFREGLGAETANRGDVVSCPGMANTCRLLRGDALVSVSEPTASGDTVRVYVNYVTKSINRRQPLYQTSLRLTLVRQSGQGWRLVERTILGIT